MLLQQNRPHHHTHQRGPQPARIFNFGGKKNNYERPSVENMGLDYYDKDEVEHYFNYMGCLATEGTYDRMEALLAGGLHPANVILLLASAENDAPKVGGVHGGAQRVEGEGMGRWGRAGGRCGMPCRRTPHVGAAAAPSHSHCTPAANEHPLRPRVRTHGPCTDQRHAAAPHHPQIKELLDAGADLSVKDNNGKGPMDLATKPEVLEMMRAKAGAK